MRTNQPAFADDLINVVTGKPGDEEAESAARIRTVFVWAARF